MFHYDDQLIFSISIRVFAFIWSIILIKKINDWRTSLLTLMLLLMTIQQSLRLFAIKTEVAGFVVSILALLVTIFMGKLILAQKKNQQDLKELNEQLEHKVLERTTELRNTNSELVNALAQVKTLSGMIPICGYCKKIRNDEQSWQQLESYISEHSDAVFSHGICPTCYEIEIKKINNPL